MCSIYEAIRRVALGENPRLVLMDLVPGEEDGGEAFIEDDDNDELDDELESDDELDIPDDEFEEAEEESASIDINPDDIPEVEG